MSKQALLDYDIHALLSSRWSPRSFANKAVESEKVRSLFEAARWAPSCFNEQPWHFILATRDESEGFGRILGCLNASNQRWAKDAGALAISVAKSAFAATGKANRHAWHDIGLAVAQLTMQASHEGLAVHQMAGFDASRAREVLGIPQGYEPATAIAIGYAGEAEALPEDLRARERALRARMRQDTFVFAGQWGAPWNGDDTAELDDVLSFWFGDLDEEGFAAADSVARWWKKDPAFDDEIRRRFGALHAAIMSGEREAWLTSARGRLAYVIVLDQLSRNMFRDTPAMFGSDERALDVARRAVVQGMDRAVAGDQRAFFYLPFMHSEQLDVQEQCVALFRAFRDELAGEGRERIANNLKFAIAHRDIVAKWGRFPHRNAILGRESSAEERAFLAQPGSSF